MAKYYTVKQGNSPWQIAHDNGLTLDEFYRLNPTVKERRMIHPGDIVKLSPEIIREDVNIRDQWDREKIANLNNVSAIQEVKHDNNYVIVDKKNKLLNVFDKNNNLIYSSNGISTGLSENDYNTITYTKNGNIVNLAGNNSTPAGITTIRNVGLYHGSPSFIRQRINRDGSLEDIASSIHIGDTKSKSSSNGCIRADSKTLQNLSQLVGVGTKVYTLPEKEGSRFTVRGGRLNFTADNPYGVTEGDKRYWDDYNVYIDKEYSPLKIKWNKTGNKFYDYARKRYAKSLVDNKQRMQKEFNLSSDEYNRLADLSLGIAEQETKFGTANRYIAKQTILSPLVRLVRGKSRSRGITQIKMQRDNKELQDYYTKNGITPTSINYPYVAATATMARLANIYNNEVKGRKFIGKNNIDIAPEEALLYKWLGQNYKLKTNIAIPHQNEYIRNVNKYSKNFQMFDVRTRTV